MVVVKQQTCQGLSIERLFALAVHVSGRVGSTRSFNTPYPTDECALSQRASNRRYALSNPTPPHLTQKRFTFPKLDTKPGPQQPWLFPFVITPDDPLMTPEIHHHVNPSAPEPGVCLRFASLLTVIHSNSEMIAVTKNGGSTFPSHFLNGFQGMLIELLGAG